MPTANSKLILYIYTTKALNAPTNFTGDGIFLFKETELKSLPIVI